MHVGHRNPHEVAYYYNTRKGDSCLTKDSCPVCRDDVTAGKGMAHDDGSTIRWWQRLVCKRPYIHAIHRACLEQWMSARLGSDPVQVPNCPTCRKEIAFSEEIAPSLKDRAISVLTHFSQNKITYLAPAVIAGLDYPYNLMLVGATMIFRNELGFEGLMATLGASGATSGIVDTVPLMGLAVIAAGGTWGEKSTMKYGITETIKKIKYISAGMSIVAGGSLIISGMGALVGSTIGRDEVHPVVLRTAGAVAGYYIPYITLNVIFTPFGDDNS